MRIFACAALFATASVAFATDMDYARLVQSVYEERGVEGWKGLTQEDLRAKGIDAELLLRRSDQWRGTVYERGEEVVVAWAGNRGGDEGIVIGQELGMPAPEFIEAAAVGKQIVEAFKDKTVIFTGHSLGGGLAGAAAYATGKNAVLFNAQGLHRNTAQAIGGEGAGQETRHYFVKGEYATLFQSLPFFPKAIGHQIQLPNLGWDPARAHNMPEVMEAMRAAGVQ